MFSKRVLKILAVFLAVVLLLTVSGKTDVAAGREIAVRVDGRPVLFDVPPQILRGRTMVPLRAIAELTGATVDWDEARQTVTVSKGGGRIVLTVGASTANLNGVRATLDSPPIIVGGRTLVPLRFISESLGYWVEWDGNARRVSLISRLERLNLVGPIAPLTFPFFRLQETIALRSMTHHTQVSIARTVDMLRAQALSGEMHFAAMPTHVAANLYNRGVNLKLVNVAVWGNLYIVGEGGAPVRSLEDLRGQRLVIPSRGDTPDLIFRFLATQKGLDLTRDVRIEYVPSPMEAAALLATGRARFAVLSEPAATSAVLRAQQEGRTLERLIALRKVWGEVTGGPDRIPQAGIVALPAVMDRNDLIRIFAEAYSEATAWAVSNPDASGVLAARGIEGVSAPAASLSLSFSELRVVPAIEVRQELELYFRKLQELAPDILGGRLPDAGFYWQPE